MSDFPETDVLLDGAVRAARAAGDHALRNRDRRNEVEETFAHDVKLTLDLEAQEQAFGVIHERFPNDAVLGEEGRMDYDRSRPCWIVDPIDGTVNFAHGMPLWCSSVAVEIQGRVVAGCVYLPEMKECYTATIDRPAECNGRRIRPSSVPALEEALILTGLSKHVVDGSPAFDVFKALSLRARKVRIMGAAAVDICHVACGRAEGYVETGIYLWDIAAAGLIARQAGARTEVLQELGDFKMRYLCTNGILHEDLRRIMEESIP